MARIRNDGWKCNSVLETWLKERVQRQYKQNEILVEFKKVFNQYAWSKRTLGLRLKHFNIKYTNSDIDIGEVVEAVSEELMGPGQNLGYRAMTKKVVEVCLITVARR